MWQEERVTVDDDEVILISLPRREQTVNISALMRCFTLLSASLDLCSSAVVCVCVWLTAGDLP